MAQREIIVREGQSLLDLALQYYGSIAGVFLLIDINSPIGLDSALPAGTKLKVDDGSAVDQSIRDYFAQRGIEVNTGESKNVFTINPPQSDGRIHNELHDDKHN